MSMASTRIDGVKLKRRHLICIVVLLCSAAAIFYVIRLSVNTRTTTKLFLNSADAVVVDHGCYYLHDVSVQTVVSRDLLLQLKCNKTFPAVIIAGVMKSGTTALRNFLRFHPQLAMGTSEPHFFDKKYHLGIQWYLEQMAYATPEQMTVEKTPNYFEHPHAPRAIWENFADRIKLIFILKEPVERAISHYTHECIVRARKEESKWRSPSDLTKEPTRIRQTRGIVKYARIKATFEESVVLPNGSVNTDTSLIDTGIYIKHLRRWFSVFSREQILLLDGDEYVSDPLPTLQRVEQFLGLRSYFKEDSFYFDRNKGFYCMAHPIRSCMQPSKGRTHPYVNEDVRQLLYRFYEPYNVELAAILKQKFSWTDSTLD